MVFSDLPVGSKFYFGTRSHTRTAYRNGRHIPETDTIKMEWKKTQDGLAVCVNDNRYICFDSGRGAGSNKYVRQHGNRYFFISRLFAYLNCADSSWSDLDQDDNSPVHDSDTHFGFLSGFNDDELAFMEPYDMTVDVPVGYNKRYGDKVTKKVLVGIPSKKQIMETFGLQPFGSTWITDADNMSMSMRMNVTYRYSPDRTSRFMAVVKIRDDAPIDVDHSGQYVIQVPETDFSGNLDLFLGYVD